MVKKSIILFAVFLLSASCNQKQVFESDTKQLVGETPLVQTTTSTPTSTSAVLDENTATPTTKTEFSKKEETPTPKVKPTVNNELPPAVPAQSGQSYTREEANQLLTSVLVSDKKLFAEDRRKLLAILIVSENELEKNLTNRVKTLTAIKGSHDVLHGSNFVADFFFKYAKDELNNQLQNIATIKGNSYSIDNSINKILEEYDQLIAQGAPFLDKNELNHYLMTTIAQKNFANEDLIDDAIEKQNIAYKAASSRYFSFIDDHYNDIFSYLTGTKFFGYQCTDYCSGHEQGWQWALSNKTSSTILCSGESQSFIEGCYVFVKQASP